MDSREFAEWIAYDRLDPFGLERGDLHAAIVAATVANAAKGRRGRRLEIADFMPKFKAAMRKPVEAVAMMLDAYIARHNARVEKAEKRKKAA